MDSSASPKTGESGSEVKEPYVIAHKIGILHVSAEALSEPSAINEPDPGLKIFSDSSLSIRDAGRDSAQSYPQ